MKYISLILIAALLSLSSACNALSNRTIHTDLKSITVDRQLSYSADRVVEQTQFSITKDSASATALLIPICEDLIGKFREISINNQSGSELNWEFTNVDNRTHISVELTPGQEKETVVVRFLAIGIATPVLFKKDSALRFDTHLFYDLPYENVTANTVIESSYDECLINDEAVNQKYFSTSSFKIDDRLSLTLFQTEPNLYVENLDTTFHYLPVTARTRVIHDMKFYNKVAAVSLNHATIIKKQRDAIVAEISITIPSTAENVRVYDRNGRIYDFSIVEAQRIESDVSKQAGNILRVKPRYPIRPNERAGFSVEFDVSTNNPGSIIFKNKQTGKFFMHSLMIPYFRPESTILNATYHLKLGPVVLEPNLLTPKFLDMLPTTTHKSTFLQRGSKQINFVANQLISSDMIVPYPIQFEWADETNHVLKSLQQLCIGFGIIVFVYKLSSEFIATKNEKDDLYAAASRAVNTN